MPKSDYVFKKRGNRDVYKRVLGPLTIEISFTKYSYECDMFLYEHKNMYSCGSIINGLNFEEIENKVASESEIVNYLKYFCECVLDKNISMEVKQ